MSKPLEWEPVLPDKLPNPEYCPSAIPEFYEKLESKSTRSYELKSNVKKHLLYLKWSIESKPQENCSDKYRYVSPDRKHTYYSLSSLCKAFVESQRDTSSLPIQGPESRMEIETGNIPLIPHDSHTWDLDLSSPMTETSFLASLLTEPFVEFTDSQMEIEQFGVQNSLTDSLLMESSTLSSAFYNHLKYPPAEFSSISQEASLEKIRFPMPQDGNLGLLLTASLPSDPPVEEILKSTVCESDDGHKAVEEYHKLGSDGAQRQKGNDRIKYLRTKAKNHLESAGWVLKYKAKSDKQELRYVSPDGRKSHNSLIKACASYLENHQNYNHTPQKRPPPFSSDNLCLTHMTTDDPRQTKKARDSSYLPLTRSTYESTSLPEKPPLTGSMAIIVADPHLTSRNGRNLLGRLIDDAEVAAGDEVYYRGRDGRPMAEGHINEEGLIKCKCCGVEMNLSSFEIHAGSTNHRPAANIFLKKTKISLQEYQTLSKPCQDDKKIKTVVKEPKRGDKKLEKVMKKPSQVDKKIKKNNFDLGSESCKCSICKKIGAVIFCYQCPSRFHTNCVGFNEVPNGDWFCKSCEDEPCNESKSCELSVIDYLMIGNILPRMNDKNKTLKDLRLKAKKHLRSIGWLFSREEATRLLEYKSPSGKVYFSLMAACEGCIFDES